MHADRVRPFGRSLVSIFFFYSRSLVSIFFFYIKHLHARVNIKSTITSHISTMICLGIKENDSKKININLTKMYKIVMFNFKKFNLKSFRDKKETYGGRIMRTVKKEMSWSFDVITTTANWVKCIMKAMF